MRGGVATVRPCARFRSSPNNGRQQTGPVGPFRARRQHSGRQLLDQLVGECEQVWRDRDTKLPCGLEIDHQPELAGLLDRQVAGLYTLNYFGSVDTGAPIAIQRISGISQEKAGPPPFGINAQGRFRVQPTDAPAFARLIPSARMRCSRVV